MKFIDWLCSYKNKKNVSKKSEIKTKLSILNAIEKFPRK